MFKLKITTIFYRVSLVVLIIIVDAVLHARPVVAGQEKNVKNRELVTVTLSSKDPNIIEVTDDRIKQYSVVKGVITASIDSQSGILNIKPAGMYNDKPFSMIIFTEKGYRYTLLFVPKKVPAQDIVLNNMQLNVVNNVAINKSPDYSTKIASLIKAMLKNENIAGYKIQTIAGNEKVKVDSVINDSLITNKGLNIAASLKLQSEYVGDDYKGEVATFKNLTNIDLTLKEEDFYSSNVVAVALSSYKLKPQDAIKVYRVVRHG